MAAAKKTAEETQAKEPAAEQKTKRTKKTVEPKKFGLKSRNVPVIFMNEQRAPGTSHMFTKPIYVPPDIEIGWAISSREDGGISIQDMLSRGWDFVPEDKVTDDLNEAITEGKICFRGVVISQLGDVENRVGLVNYGLVLMFRNKDVSQKFEETLASRFRDYFRAHIMEEGIEEAELSKGVRETVEKIK